MRSVREIFVSRSSSLMVPGVPGNVIHVRAGHTLELVLDDVFPPIDNGSDQDTAERARALLMRSHQLLCGGDMHGAFDCAQALTDLLPGVVDGPAQKIRATLQADWAEPGLAAAREALALAPKSAELHYVAGIFANAAREPQEAAQYLGLFLEQGDDRGETERANAHLALGSALDDLDQVFAGLAHVEIARSMGGDHAELLNTLGYLLRRAGQPERAAEAFHTGLQVDPAHPSLLINHAAALIEAARYDQATEAIAALEVHDPTAPQLAGLRDLLAELAAQGGQGARVALMDLPPWRAPEQIVECSSCAAWIPMQAREMLCGRCGSVLSAPGLCPCCRSDGRVVLIPGLETLCPYCRSGHLTVSEVEGAPSSGMARAAGDLLKVGRTRDVAFTPWRVSSRGIEDGTQFIGCPAGPIGKC